MSKKFLVPIDLNQLEIQNVALQSLGSAPSSPVQGQVYFNTVQNKAFIWDGSNWIPWEVSAGNVTGVKGNAESTYRTGNVNLTPANIGAVPTTRTVNGHALSSNVTITASDIGVEAGAEVNVQSDWNVTSNTSDAYIKNKPTIGAAAAKGVDTSISSGSTSTNLPTTQAVANFVSSEIGAVDAMRFKGTIGTGGDISSLPTSGVKVGDTYRVITAGTYAGQTCEIGDLIIATSTTPTWTVAQTNIDGAITNITGTSPVSVTGSGSTRNISVPVATTTTDGLLSSIDKDILDTLGSMSFLFADTVTITAGQTSADFLTTDFDNVISWRAYDATTNEDVVVDASKQGQWIRFSIATAYSHNITIKVIYY